MGNKGTEYERRLKGSLLSDVFALIMQEIESAYCLIEKLGMIGDEGIDTEKVADYMLSDLTEKDADELGGELSWNAMRLMELGTKVSERTGEACSDYGRGYGRIFDIEGDSQLVGSIAGRVSRCYLESLEEVKAKKGKKNGKR